MNLFDQIILLATGLTAIYLIVRFFQDNKRASNPVYNVYYLISFIVLLVSGLLLIALSYSILPNPLVIVVTTLLPLGIALGLVHEFYPKLAKPYLVFALVGLLSIIITRFTVSPRGLQIFTLAFFHSIAGLTVFLIPILVVNAKKAPTGFVFVTVGGTLIGLGGIALAFLKSGGQLLFFSAEFVYMILAPLLLLMTLAFTYGFVKKIVAAKKG